MQLFNPMKVTILEDIEPGTIGFVTKSAIAEMMQAWANGYYLDECARRLISERKVAIIHNLAKQEKGE